MDLVTPTDMLSIDKDVGDGALPRLLGKLSLDLGSLGMLVELNGDKRNLELVKEALGLLAIRAVALREDLYRCEYHQFDPLTNTATLLPVMWAWISCLMGLDIVSFLRFSVGPAPSFLD